MIEPVLILIAIAGLVLIFMLIDLRKDFRRAERIRRAIPQGSEVWVMFGGRPEKMLLVHHGKDFATCRYGSSIIDVDYDQIIFEI